MVSPITASIPAATDVPGDAEEHVSAVQDNRIVSRVESRSPVTQVPTPFRVQLIHVIHLDGQ